VIFEKSDVLAKGVAYGASSPCHILNLPTSSMSLTDDPRHFYAWMKTNEATWKVRKIRLNY
jgi:uncharacterized NAD(P)/FAD-binding protein YdhS